MQQERIALNADLGRRVVVDSNRLAWQPSPMAGVLRRALDFEGSEQEARATTLVRFQPGSFFSAHRHAGGEEFLVLEGVFSDETGDFGAGWYVRNPAGSHHQPHSAPGCVIFVKLSQMDAADQAVVRVDTNDPVLWRDGRAGERMLMLHTTAHEQVTLLHWEPGARLAAQRFPGGAEYLVLEGAFRDGDGEYRTGCWLRLPPGSTQEIVAESATRVYRKTGHLAGG